MVLSKIYINKVKEQKNCTVAMASVILDDQLAIDKMKVNINKDGGLFLSMPSFKKTKESKRFVDYVHPINSEFRTYLETEVFAAFKEMNDSGKTSIIKDFTK